MINKVLKYIERYRMLEPGDTIVAGVSGGADSVCLLFVLLELQKQISFTIKVVHVNHGIRPDAGKDAAYVRELCIERGLPFYLVEADVKEGAKRRGISEEEEGRRIRYQAFEKALGGKKGRIAVAHNSNDRAETMLFHLFRGTGIAGLAGIRPVNGKVIRPLLCLSREEIESWLEERNISFCRDSTNEQDIYTRNKIRHHILPYAEEEICRGAALHMNRAAEQLMEAEEYLARMTKSALERCVRGEWESCSEEESRGERESCSEEKGRRIRISLADFWAEDEYLRGRILLECVAKAAGSRKDITAAHIDSALQVLKGRGNKEVNLPYGLVVYKEYDWGMIQKKGRGKELPVSGEEYEISVPSRVEIPGLGWVETALFARKESQNIPEKTYTKWFDYDKITSSVVFRHRQKGDYLTINSRMGKKSLQDYFVNEKIPKGNRDGIFLLAEGSHVLWVPGRRISEYYKITEDTRTVLQVSVVDKES